MGIYLPSGGSASWQALLADPIKHWKPGYSAWAVAHSWEAAGGLPPEIDALLGGSTELLVAIPEHKVPLPGGQRASQCDVFAIVRQGDQTIAVAVEGKVNEPFGPSLGEWLKSPSAGKELRLQAIADLLGKRLPLPPELNYQLLHRTAAALIEAKRFKTDRAAMIVQSFSPTGMWFEAFAFFADFLGVKATVGQLATPLLPSALPLQIGWAKGDPRFLLA